MGHGIFFSFDGIDGAGKSTQLTSFCEWLRGQGYSIVTCRDPGSTELGESIRGLLLDRHELAICRRSEMLLYMAARAQMVDEIIRPALASGQVIVSDRYLLANVVYQGHAGGLDVAEIWRVGETATAGIQPDLTFILDLDVGLAWSRIRREHDRMESQGEVFLEKVRKGFLAEAARDPQRLRLIDASRDRDAIQTDIRHAAEAFLKALA